MRHLWAFMSILCKTSAKRLSTYGAQESVPKGPSACDAVGKRDTKETLGVSLHPRSPFYARIMQLLRFY